MKSLKLNTAEKLLKKLPDEWEAFLRPRGKKQTNTREKPGCSFVRKTENKKMKKLFCIYYFSFEDVLSCFIKEINRVIIKLHDFIKE